MIYPETKLAFGKNTICSACSPQPQPDRSRRNPPIKSIPLRSIKLKSNSDGKAVLLDFPVTVRKGTTHTIAFYYSGHPVESGRFGVFTFKHDAADHSWTNTAR